MEVASTDYNPYASMHFIFDYMGSIIIQCGELESIYLRNIIAKLFLNHETRQELTCS